MFGGTCYTAAQVDGERVEAPLSRNDKHRPRFFLSLSRLASLRRTFLSVGRSALGNGTTRVFIFYWRIIYREIFTHPRLGSSVLFTIRPATFTLRDNARGGYVRKRRQFFKACHNDSRRVPMPSGRSRSSFQASQFSEELQHSSGC